jgi:hypothetical protein
LDQINGKSQHLSVDGPKSPRPELNTTTRHPSAGKPQQVVNVLIRPIESPWGRAYVDGTPYPDTHAPKPENALRLASSVHQTMDLADLTLSSGATMPATATLYASVGRAEVAVAGIAPKSRPPASSRAPPRLHSVRGKATRRDANATDR